MYRTVLKFGLRIIFVQTYCTGGKYVVFCMHTKYLSTQVHPHAHMGCILDVPAHAHLHAAAPPRPSRR